MTTVMAHLTESRNRQSEQERNLRDRHPLRLLRLADATALSVVNAEAVQELDDLGVPGSLHDGPLAGRW